MRFRSLVSLPAYLLLILGFSVNAAAPEFSAKDLTGKEHNLSDYAGKMIVLNYWATWCPPCREELPVLAIFHEEHQDKDAVVLGVASEKISIEALSEFVDEQMIDYPILPMAPSLHTPFGKLVGLPTSFLISPDGQQIKAHLGPLTQKQLETYLQEFK
jgi:thiol-disulfide isomerase/thioredoxin